MSCLADLVDQEGINGVLDLLAEVCRDHANYARYGHDFETAGIWTKAAHAVDVAAQRARELFHE